MTATLITCSFRGDLDICRLLCRSIDLHAGAGIEHRLYVPARDLPLFAELAAPRRRIEAQESLLPRWFWKAPMPGPVWRRRLRLPRRNVYFTPFHGAVRGWIAQQIMKIAASLRAEGEIVAHVDSNSALVQPLEIAHLSRAGRTRFYAGAVVERHDGHAIWYDQAARLFDLPAADYYVSDYIAPLVVWRRPVVEAMTRRIEATTGRSWPSALAATRHFSEYVLYGVFAEAALGLDAAVLQRESRSLCLTRWVEDFDDPVEIEQFLAQADTDQLVCCLQSTLALPLRTRSRIFREAGLAIAALRSSQREAVA